jgi:pheromone shutdown protein TraB
MKKVILYLVLAVLCTTSYSFSKPTSIPESHFPINSREVYIPVGHTGQLISLMDLSQISVKDFEKLSDKKMKFADKVKFKLGQRELRKKINEDGTFNSKQIENYLNASQKKGILMNISWAGLALGLFLNIIGVLIAYLITSKEGNRSMIKWAWIGAIISAIVWGAVLL